MIALNDWRTDSISVGRTQKNHSEMNGWRTVAKSAAIVAYSAVALRRQQSYHHQHQVTAPQPS